MKNNTRCGNAPNSYPVMATMHRWKYSALAAAALASVALYAPDASALALGPVTVQSSLGEPLRAEIALPSITPAEAGSLKVNTAAPEVFRSQGMDYSGAAAQVRMALQRKPDGSSVLRLSSNAPVNEPFVDLVIDATWATGRITRSYTMLFDPPTMRRPAPAVTAAPQISAPASVTRATPVAPTRAPVVLTQRAAPVSSASPDNVTVKAGDTAGRIASAHRPRSVSLDQMLVALLRANPEAFIDGNVNRVKAGAVLQLPNETQASATPAAEARQTIAAQSRDFNAFRRKLASAVPAAETAASSRSESGRIQTQVDEQKSASSAPDKLTLSKGAVKGTKATPEALAERKQASEASARVEELSRNISELNKLAGASTAAGTAAPAAATGAVGEVTTGSAPAVTGPAVAPAAPASSPAVAPISPAASASSPAEDAAAEAPVVAASGAEPVAPAAAEMSPASAPEAAASAPAAPVPAQPAAVAAPAAPAAEEPGIVDDLLENPLIPGGVLLLLLLLGYGGYRIAERRRNQQGVDSSFLESRLQPDSFFGASGGQRVDTAGTDSTGSSMAYSPSQLDAGGDVDPVAEADVYLAYGRDLQAEEILKEAIRHNPDRVSVHAKLAEIYAKRQDRKSLEATAKDIFRITNGEGGDWNRVTELGRDLDPENMFYQPGGQNVQAPELTPPSHFASTYGAAEGPPSLPSDLDLDLDLDLPEDALTDAPTPVAAAPGNFAAAAAAASASVASAAPVSTPVAAPVREEPAWSPPTGSGNLTWEQPETPVPAPETPVQDSTHTDGGHDFPLDLPSLDTQPQELEPYAEAPFKPSDSGLMDFDLGHISLDLDGKTATTPQTGAVAPEAPAIPDDPLATKLALAHEFDAIGDSDGARTLIEEVIAESSGELKARAQRMLSELN